MSTYVMSDIHGAYSAYQKMLKKIKFSDDDTLYILGDVIDRGKDGLKILNDMMFRVNVFPILGNHEYMAINCLRFLNQEITDESISNIPEDFITGLFEWQNVGGQTTIDEFHKLSPEERADILEYIEEFDLYDEITVNNKDYILVHAGLSNFSSDKDLEDYALHELIFETPDYNTQYFSDKYLVTGHLPTRNIEENFGIDKIYRANNHIAIDCGCGFGGKLGCICLDTDEEFYVDLQEENFND